MSGQTNIPITEGSGTDIDASQTTGTGNLRQTITIGDPLTDGDVAQVTSAKALQVDIGATTANSTALKVEGAGTAGTPSGGVLSIQGVSSGTAVPVSLSSVAVTQATASSLNVQSQIYDGTNIANVVAGDSGFNGLAVASATKTYTFSTSSSGAQTILANTPTEGFSYIEIVFSSVGSGLALSGQYSTASGGTYSNSSTFSSSSGGAVTTLGTSASTVYFGPIRGNYFQIAVSALTSGTFAGTVTLRATAPPPTTVNVTQQGTWTVGSNSATGSAVPANAFYAAMDNSGGNLTGLRTVGAMGDAGSADIILAVGQGIFNGTNWDRIRSANAAAGTTGTGLTGVGLLGYDGTDWQYTGIDASHNLKVNIEAIGATSLPVVGLGTAGSPSGGVLTVQGASSMTALSTTDTNIASTTAALNGTLPADASLDGAQVRTSEQSALSNGKITAYVADKVGKQIVLLNANPENFGSAVATATGTSSTSTGLSSPGSGLKWYITDIILTNSGGTTVTVNLQNGSGGSTIATGIAPAGGGHSINFRTPLNSMSTNTVPYFACSGSSSTVSITISGYIGA